LSGFPGLQVSERGTVSVAVRNTAELAAITRCLEDSGVATEDIEVARPSLNDVFFVLTDRGEPSQEVLG
jgi:hypothetical protein